MSSIRRRPNGKWRARYRDKTNKEHAGHFDTRAGGQRWLDEQTTGLVTGTYVDPKAGKVTFKDYAESWRGAQVHRSSTSTSVEQQLRLHVYPTIGARQLRSIRPSDIQALVRTLGESLSPSTVEVIYSRVAAVFNAAVRDRVLATTACVDVKRPQGPPSSTLDVLTTDQVFSLVDAMPDRYKALILTGAGTGLRPGELFGLPPTGSIMSVEN
jgi:integrase